MAIGNNKEHDEGIEREQPLVQYLICLRDYSHFCYLESGNMLIMTYAHAQRTGDISLLSRHVRV